MQLRLHMGMHPPRVAVQQSLRGAALDNCSQDIALKMYISRFNRSADHSLYRLLACAMGLQSLRQKTHYVGLRDGVAVPRAQNALYTNAQEEKL